MIGHFVLVSPSVLVIVHFVLVSPSVLVIGHFVLVSPSVLVIVVCSVCVSYRIDINI